MGEEVVVAMRAMETVGVAETAGMAEIEECEGLKSVWVDRRDIDGRHNRRCSADEGSIRNSSSFC